MYRASPTPVTDWTDICLAGVKAYWEDEMVRLINVVLLTIVGLSLFAAGYSLAELRDGLREVPMHWWSTAPFVMTSMGVGVWLGMNVIRSKRARIEGTHVP
jgi:hypothetical protein